MDKTDFFFSVVLTEQCETEEVEIKGLSTQLSVSISSLICKGNDFTKSSIYFAVLRFDIEIFASLY